MRRENEEGEKNKIREYAKGLGFETIGFTDATDIAPQYKVNFTDWLSEGKCAEMEYLRKNLDKRFSPEKLLPGAKSVIVFAAGYNALATTPEKTKGIICDYACFEDYHKIIKEKIFQTANYIQTNLKKDLKIKACVDSVPINERSLAARAGIGFIGKNGMLIIPGKGVRFLLGLLISNLDVAPDLPQNANGCENCMNCIKACPTGALGDDGRINCNRCISYQTIENKGSIPDDITKAMEQRLYGCDECVNVCPHNQPTTSFLEQLLPKQISLEDIINMDAKLFTETFGRTAILRTGIEKLRQTAQIINND